MLSTQFGLTVEPKLRDIYCLAVIDSLTHRIRGETILIKIHIV